MYLQYYFFLLQYNPTEPIKPAGKGDDKEGTVICLFCTKYVMSKTSLEQPTCRPTNLPVYVNSVNYSTGFSINL